MSELSVKRFGPFLPTDIITIPYIARLLKFACSDRGLYVYYFENRNNPIYKQTGAKGQEYYVVSTEEAFNAQDIYEATCIDSEREYEFHLIRKLV